MNHSYSIIIIIALILFSIYRRVRRNIGWQLINQGNLVFRTVLFFIFGLLFLTEGVFHATSFISDLIGILLGFILAYYGVSLTSFEQREGRLYYRPNIWIGSILTVIFLARFISRFYGLFTGGALGGLQSGQTNGLQNIGSIGNSWTAGLMLIMFAYYAIYYLVLLRKQKQFLQSGKSL